MLAAAAVAVVAVTAITAATLGSDGGGSAATPGIGTPTPPDGGRTVDGLVFAHQPDQTAGDAALLEGTVAGAGGCLVITSADRVVTVSVFPVPGTAPASLRVGDRVSLSGGYTDSGHLPADVSVPDQCRHATAPRGGFFLAWTMTILHRAAGASGTPPLTPGEVPVDPTTEAPPAPIGPVKVGVDTGWAATAAQHLAMTLQTGSRLQVTSTDSDAELPGAAASSDGTPWDTCGWSPHVPRTPARTTATGLTCTG